MVGDHFQQMKTQICTIEDVGIRPRWISLITNPLNCWAPVPLTQINMASVHVRDLMASAGANSLGTTTNLEKMAIEIPAREPSNSLVKLPQVTLACYPARLRLIN